MKKKIFFLILFFSLILSVIICFAQEEIKVIDADKFIELQKKYPKMLIIDVREKDEILHSEIHVDGAINIALSKIKKNPTLIPKTNQPIVFISNNKKASREAAKIAIENGYKEVYSLDADIENLLELKEEIIKMPTPEDSPTEILEEDMGC